jgi:hypothetical protein
MCYTRLSIFHAVFHIVMNLWVTSLSQLRLSTCSLQRYCIGSLFCLTTLVAIGGYGAELVLQSFSHQHECRRCPCFTFSIFRSPMSPRFPSNTHNASETPTMQIAAPTPLVWFGWVYLFIHSVTYVTLETSITDYNLQHIL